MTTKKGFTLIELLVVVLIIGILAAVALPQYELTVEKTKAEILIANIRALRGALELYRLENGVYPHDSLTDVTFDLQGCALKQDNSSVIVCPDSWMDLNNWNDVEHATIVAYTGKDSTSIRTQITYSVDQDKFTCYSKISKLCNSLSIVKR